MAVVALKSSAITNATATPVVLNSANLVNGNLRESQGFAVITNGDTGATSGAVGASSTYRLFRLRSSDRVSLIRIYAPDIGTTTVAGLGLYDKLDTNAGAAVSVEFFASQVVLNAGAINGTDLTFEAAAAGGLIANAEKRIWECLSLTSDPCKEYDVVLWLYASADATGTALVRIQFVSGE
jgi:hypothetical protein